MAISAPELFESYSRKARDTFPWYERQRDEGSSELLEERRVQVTGVVARALLGVDRTAKIVLQADARGMATIVCACLSDDVLFRVRDGDTVTLEGVCRGLEDALTLVMDMGELIGPKKPYARLLHIVPASSPKSPQAEPVVCDFCGRDLREEPRLLLCEECAHKCAACGGYRRGPAGT